jgi:glycosyltransferase involved in cell wall biosynthesis
MAAILSRVPAFIHVEHTISDGKQFYYILINKALSLFTDNIICVSESVRQSLIKTERLNTNKVVVIHNGLSTERFSPIRSKCKIQHGIKRVGIVGRFSQEKGHIYFVEAATKIIQFFKNVEFIFVGDGPLRPMIEQKVREYSLDTCCHFLGVRSDIGVLFQTLDVFVLPSLREGLSISLLEAQYLGVASVVTDVGGNPEVIKNGYNGLVVSPKDPDALASAILRVLTDNELRNKFILHGKEVFTEKFSVEKMADSYLEIINNILNHKYNNNSISI